MGPVTKPGSVVYLDSQILIYSIETHERYWPLLEPLWSLAQQRKIRMVTSEMALMEVLVAPMRSGDAPLISAYEELFRSPDLDLVPVTLPVLREAAALRARIASLRAPDAIHAASAIRSACTVLLTNDAALRAIPGIEVVMLEQCLKSHARPA
jgi:predicted nucleic acid-binding protein